MKLNKKDTILAKDTGRILLDATIDEIAKRIPFFNIPWELSKALYGAGMKLRQEKALEWVEMVRDNPSVFTESVLSDPAFQDGFVVALEKYLTERSEEKRKYYRKIFLGFARAENKGTFPLEKYTHTLTQLDEIDMEVLKDINFNEEGRNYQIYGNNANRIENIYNLISQGILLDTTGNRIGHNHENSPFVKISLFGKEFVKYIQKDK